MIKDSVILLEQLRTIDKQRLKEKICHIDEELQEKVDYALKSQFGTGYIVRTCERSKSGNKRKYLTNGGGGIIFFIASRRSHTDGGAGVKLACPLPLPSRMAHREALSRSTVQGFPCGCKSTQTN